MQHHATPLLRHRNGECAKHSTSNLLPLRSKGDELSNGGTMNGHKNTEASKKEEASSDFDHSKNRGPSVMRTYVDEDDTNDDDEDVLTPIGDMTTHTSCENTMTHTFGEVPSPRAYHASCLMGDVLWIYGGTLDTTFDMKTSAKPYDDMFALDLNPNSENYLVWRKENHPNGPGQRCKHAMTCYGTNIYIFGGWDGSRRCNDIRVFDTLTSEWTTILPQGGKATQANWPAPHTSHAQCVVGDTWIIVGRGETGTHKKYGCDIDFFDFTENRWTLGGARFNSRSGHTLSVMKKGKTICMLGGRKEVPVEFFDVAKYIPNDTMKKRIQSMQSGPLGDYRVANLAHRGPPFGRSFHGSANIPRTNQFACYGGFLEGNVSTQRCLYDATGEVVIYDADNDAWYTAKVDLPPRGAHCLHIRLLPVQKERGTKKRHKKDVNVKTYPEDVSLSAELVVFGGTHRGHVFNDLHIANLPLTLNNSIPGFEVNGDPLRLENGKKSEFPISGDWGAAATAFLTNNDRTNARVSEMLNTIHGGEIEDSRSKPRVRCAISRKAKSLDPMAFQSEVNSIFRSLKAEKALHEKNQVRKEKIRKNALRDRRGHQMREALKQNERTPKCPRRMRSPLGGSINITTTTLSLVTPTASDKPRMAQSPPRTSPVKPGGTSRVRRASLGEKRSLSERAESRSRTSASPRRAPRVASYVPSEEVKKVSSSSSNILFQSLREACAEVCAHKATFSRAQTAAHGESTTTMTYNGNTKTNGRNVAPMRSSVSTHLLAPGSTPHYYGTKSLGTLPSRSPGDSSNNNNNAKKDDDDDDKKLLLKEHHHFNVALATKNGSHRRYGPGLATARMTRTPIDEESLLLLAHSSAPTNHASSHYHKLEKSPTLIRGLDLNKHCVPGNHVSSHHQKRDKSPTLIRGLDLNKHCVSANGKPKGRSLYRAASADARNRTSRSIASNNSGSKERSSSPGKRCRSVLVPSRGVVGRSSSGERISGRGGVNTCTKAKEKQQQPQQQPQPQPQPQQHQDGHTHNGRFDQPGRGQNISIVLSNEALHAHMQLAPHAEDFELGVEKQQHTAPPAARGSRNKLNKMPPQCTRKSTPSLIQYTSSDNHNHNQQQQQQQHNEFEENGDILSPCLGRRHSLPLDSRTQGQVVEAQQATSVYHANAPMSPLDLATRAYTDMEQQQHHHHHREQQQSHRSVAFELTIPQQQQHGVQPPQQGHPHINTQRNTHMRVPRVMRASSSTLGDGRRSVPTPRVVYTQNLATITAHAHAQGYHDQNHLLPFRLSLLPFMSTPHSMTRLIQSSRGTGTNATTNINNNNNASDNSAGISTQQLTPTKEEVKMMHAHNMNTQPIMTSPDRNTHTMCHPFIIGEKENESGQQASGLVRLQHSMGKIPEQHEQQQQLGMKEEATMCGTTSSRSTQRMGMAQNNFMQVQSLMQVPLVRMYR